MSNVINDVQKLPEYAAAQKSNPDIIQHCLKVKYRREDDELPALEAQELLKAGLQASLQASLQVRRPTSAECDAALLVCFKKDPIFAEKCAAEYKKRGWT